MGRSNLLIAVVFLGCGNVRSENPDAPPEPEPGSFTLQLKSQNAPVPLDGQAHVTLEIARAGSFTGAVTLAGVNLPGGVTVMPATIAEGATSAEVTVGGGAPLAINDKVTYSLQGSGDGVEPQTVTITDALVTGQPGTLDASFGAGATGVARVGIGGDAGRFNALDVVNDKIIATGFDLPLSATVMVTVRLTAEGAVDPAWNSGAVSRSKFPGGSSGDTAIAVATGRQSDGRSIVIGFNADSGSNPPCPCTPNIAAIRYSLTGVTNQNDIFGLAGEAQSDLGGNENVADGLVLPDSSIVVVGTRSVGSSPTAHFLIAQLTSSGSLDTTGFAAPTGFEQLVVNDHSEAVSVIADTTNHLVVAGNFFEANNTPHPFLVRYNKNGAHDATFGAAGQVVIADASGERAIRLRAANDRFVLASQANGSTKVRKLNADGTLDMTFGTSGVTDVPVADLRDMVISPDGSIIVLGNVSGKALLVRLTSRGAVDNLFGPNGDGTSTVFLGDSGNPATVAIYSGHLILVGGGDEGGTPGPGTFGVVARVWN